MKNKETIEQFNSLLTLTKSFVNNDLTKKLLTFMAERNKKLRKHDIGIMKLLFRELRPPSPILFHYHIPSSNGNSYRF